MKAFRPLILLFVVLTLLVPTGFVGGSARAADILTFHEETPIPQWDEALAYAPDRIIIKFHSEVMPDSTIQGAPVTEHASLDTILSAYTVQSASRLFGTATLVEFPELAQIYVLKLLAGTDLNTLITILEVDPNVEWAEPDYLAFLAATTPNDPHFADQWGLTKIKAPDAWDVTTGSATVPIAIVDSGIEFSHPDLSGNLWVNPGEIADNGLDDDNNGYVDDIHGWNILNDNADLSDNTGHGTQVAGIIAAKTDNGKGIAGMCWNCRLMTVKVIQPGGVANYSDIAAGVAYAAQKGAKVINLSLGGYSDSATLRAAIASASQTAVVVGGAGNDDNSAPFYPAAYDAYVLAVAGTTSTDTKVSDSNYGSWVDVSAPGDNITTAFDGGGYGATSGTSVAAPFASGLAGLLRSQNPGWSPNTVRAQIAHAAHNIDAQNPSLQGQLGSGRLDAAQAMSTAALPNLLYMNHSVGGVPHGRPEPGSTVDLDVTIYNDWADAANVQGRLSTSDPNATVTQATASYDDIGAYQTGTNTSSFHFSISSSAAYGHDLAFTLRLTADGGYSRNIPLTIPTSPGVTNVHGTITTQTWTNDRIYVVDNDVGVGVGETLTIEPGTVVRFDGYHTLSIAGTLFADGTEEQPIRFTSNYTEPHTGDWRRIKFLDSSTDATYDAGGNYAGGSILRHAIIEYGEGVQLEDAAPHIAHNVLQDLSGSESYCEACGILSINHNADSGLMVVDNVLIGSGIYVQQDGAATIARNSISKVSSWGIVTFGPLNIIDNRIVDCGTGIYAQQGLISGNLVANSPNYGLQIDGGLVPTIVSNTVVYNGSSAVYIEYGAPELDHNNLIASDGQYALQTAGPEAINASGNWWGTSDETAIQARIYDGQDQFGLGTVTYGGYLSAPAQGAPAYVGNVTVLPDTTLGIQTATFEVGFSRPMDQSVNPVVEFYATQREKWTVYDDSNSAYPLNHYETRAIAIDEDGAKWFATEGGGALRFDDTTWTVYDETNSGVPINSLLSMAIDNDGIKWFGMNYARGVARFDGATWTVYDSFNSDMPAELVSAIAIDSDEAKWFGTLGGGVVKLGGTTWTVYNQSNSGLPDDRVASIALGADDAKWFGTDGGGAARFDGTTWTVYNESNSGLPSNSISTIAVDVDGTTWFGTAAPGVARFDGTTWTTYNELTTEGPMGNVQAIAIDDDGTKWFGTNTGLVRFDGATTRLYNTGNSGLAGDHIFAITQESNGLIWLGTNEHGLTVLLIGEEYPVTDNYQWLDATHWRATYDMNSLVPRDDYTVSISGAKGTDGMEIVPDSRFGFAVDYAGQITDKTPPPSPFVLASGIEGDASKVTARWSASDPDSTITGYRYAIGSSMGQFDIVSWTSTSQTKLTRGSLGLVTGDKYWFAVQARNEGGLWSPIGSSSFIAGQANPKAYLPVIRKNR